MNAQRTMVGQSTLTQVYQYLLIVDTVVSFCTSALLELAIKQIPISFVTD